MIFIIIRITGFPGSVVKNLPGNAGDRSSIPGWKRFSGGGNDNPLQYSCLGNATDRGAWWVMGLQRVGHHWASKQQQQQQQQ